MSSSCGAATFLWANGSVSNNDPWESIREALALGPGIQSLEGGVAVAVVHNAAFNSP